MLLRKDFLKNVKRIVLKIGTNLLTTEEKDLDEKVIKKIAKEALYCQNKNIRLTIVSSGAITAGLKVLNLSKRPTNIPALQASAAIGQINLIAKYQQCFLNNNMTIGQILLSTDDVHDRNRYLNIRNSLNELYKNRVVPILNENDSVNIEELKFGDNDQLSAIIASITDADLLVIYSDIDGLYTDNPKKNKQAAIIKEVKKLDASILALARDKENDFSLGGMTSKLQAAKAAKAAGIGVFLGHGKKITIQQILEQEAVGTFFYPSVKKIQSRKRWLGFSPKIMGQLHIDNGCKKAICRNNKSLLPSGIIDVAGKFTKGCIIEIIDSEQNSLGKGISNYSAEEINKIKGRKSSEIKNILGHISYEEVIHRDNLYIFDT